MTDKIMSLREALDAELARQGRPTMATAKDATYHRKVIRGLSGFAAVEARALVDDLERIGTLTIRGEKQSGQDTDAMHAARLSAWANLDRVKDALVNLGNEIDRLGA